jgi:hypothetical protein
MGAAVKSGPNAQTPMNANLPHYLTGGAVHAGDRVRYKGTACTVVFVSDGEGGEFIRSTFNPAGWSLRSKNSYGANSRAPVGSGRPGSAPAVPKGLASARLDGLPQPASLVE